MRYFKAAAGFIFCLLLIPSMLSVISTSGFTLTDSDSSLFSTNGPYLDKVVYNTITQDDQQVLALQDNDIDAICDTVDFSFIDSLVASENIELSRIQRNGYAMLAFNCSKYPLNITGFRRAFAFGFDKVEIAENIWDGFAKPLDSCVPEGNPFSIEGELDYSYYSDNTSIGNSILDDLGFHDIDFDGYREAPNGEPFSVRVCAAISSNIAMEIGALAVDTLQHYSSILLT